MNLFRKTIFIKESKNKEVRTIPLNQKALEVLIRKSKIRSIKTKLLFPTSVMTKWDKCNMGRDFRKAIKKAKIENIRFHDLRHTFGSRLAQAGVDINTIARLMGHKRLNTTKRYVHHTVESLRVGVERLESFGHNLDTVGGISQGAIS